MYVYVREGRWAEDGVWAEGTGATKDASCSDRVWMQGSWRQVLVRTLLAGKNKTELRVASAKIQLPSLENTGKFPGSHVTTCSSMDGRMAPPVLCPSLLEDLLHSYLGKTSSRRKRT